MDGGGLAVGVFGKVKLYNGSAVRGGGTGVLPWATLAGLRSSEGDLSSCNALVALKDGVGPIGPYYKVG